VTNFDLLSPSAQQTKTKPRYISIATRKAEQVNQNLSRQHRD
jgi:hypothetical protein